MVYDNTSCQTRFVKYIFSLFKDIRREKLLPNKTPALRKSTNMGIWNVGTSNQLFIRGSFTETKFSKN